MKDKLTEEEILHVAKLARIEITEDELESYQVKLKEILNQIDSVNEIDDDNTDYLIAPWKNNANFREDIVLEMLDTKEALKNTPHKSGSFIEVPVVISNE